MSRKHRMHRVDKVGAMAWAFFLCGCALSCEGSQERKSVKPDPLAERVINYKDPGPDFAGTIIRLAEKYRLRVGIDIETPPQNQRVSVEVQKGTVADVLDRIVAQEPDYRWGGSRRRSEHRAAKERKPNSRCQDRKVSRLPCRCA